LKLPRVANAGSSLTFQVKGTAAGVAIQSASQIVNLSERPKADITGRVMLEQNGVSEAVSGARVTLDRQSYSVLTDAAGYFTLSSVFIDDALEIKVSHELRGESLVWEQRALPQVNAGIVDVGNLLFHDDDVTTLYDESTGNELQFKPNNTEYRYYPSMDFSFHGYPVDYISIRKDYGYLSLYDRNGYAIQYINALPVNQFSFQKMAGIRVHESEGYLAITYDSVAIDGVANSAMTMQLQFQSTGNVKILYGSTAIDLRNYMNGYLDFQFRGNDSGNYESANLDFSALTSADPYIIKPYKRFSLNEYFYSSAAFDLMGNVVEFDYDFSSGFRIWSEPLTSIPVPLQYLQ
nr:carboxypeptidase regulatory-like domain-containing protein [Gammaproteobacteria bacterium]